MSSSCLCLEVCWCKKSVFLNVFFEIHLVFLHYDLCCVLGVSSRPLTLGREEDLVGGSSDNPQVRDSLLRAITRDLCVTLAAWPVCAMGVIRRDIRLECLWGA